MKHPQEYGVSSGLKPYNARKIQYTYQHSVRSQTAKHDGPMLTSYAAIRLELSSAVLFLTPTCKLLAKN